jgi:hypothetical protein
MEKDLESRGIVHVHSDVNITKEKRREERL